MSDPVLQAFGSYVLLGELGRGATSVVYQARHLPTNRTVALKVIRGPGVLTAEDRRRFRVEAEAATALDHPHIIPVYEVGEAEGLPFLTMKLMPAGTLADRLAEEQVLPSPQAATLLAAVARAVHHAHQRGVLHRDLKPGNILLDDADEPHLSDFGLAKLTQAGPTVTQPQAFLGTPAYMAPEVVSDGVRSATVAADIYALGAVLYELLAGRPPFAADTVPALLRQIVESDLVPPSRVRAHTSLTRPAGTRSRPTGEGSARASAGKLAAEVASASAPCSLSHRMGEGRGEGRPIPRDLEAICLRCLSRNPAKRYETAETLADDLDRFLRGDPVSARVPSPLELARAWLRRHRVAAAWGTALLTCLVGGLALTSTQWQRAEAHLRESESSRRRLAVLATASVDRLFDARQPHDGVIALAELLQAYPENQVAAMRLFCALTQSSWTWPVHPPFPHAGEVVQGAFTPDGRWMMTAAKDREGLRIWDAAPTSGTLRATVPHDTSRGIAFAMSGDGKALATVGTNGEPLLWDLSDVRDPSRQPSPIRWERESGHAPQANPVTALAFDSRGAWFATGDVRGSVWLHRLAATNVGTRMLTPTLDAPIRELAFHSSDGFMLAVGNDTAQVWRLPEVEPLSGPIRTPTPIISAAFARHAPRLLVAAGNLLQVWDLDSGTLRKQHQFNSGIRAADLSPNGERMAVTHREHQVRLLGAIGGDALGPRVEHARVVNTVRFNPSGDILISASDDFTALAWPTAPRNLALYAPMRHHLAVRDAIPSPDNAHVLTISDDQTARLWALWHLPTRAVGVPGLATAQEFLFTPDGDKLVVIMTNAQVRVYHTPDGALLGAFPAEPGSRPGTWSLSPSGRTFALQEAGGTMRLLDVGKLAAPPRVLRHATELTCLALSSDDKRLAAASAGSLALWKLETTNAAPAWVLPLEGANALDFSADSDRLLASGRPLRTAHVIDTQTGRVLATTAPDHDPVEWACFSLDSRLVATRSEAGRVRVWNGTNAEPVTPWIQTGGPVASLDFRPDGQWLAVGSIEGVVRLFDARTGAAVGSPLAVERGQASVEFSPDGEWLVTAEVEGTDGRVTLWHAASGVAVSEPIRYRGLRGARFSRDGQRLLSGNVRRFSAGNILNQAHLHLYGPAALPANDLLLTMTELVTNTRLEPGRPCRELTADEFRARQDMLKARYGVPAPTPHLITLR